MCREYGSKHTCKKAGKNKKKTTRFIKQQIKRLNGVKLTKKSIELSVTKTKEVKVASEGPCDIARNAQKKKCDVEFFAVS